MEKWKKKTMNQMLTDANKGDSAALYMIGGCYLYGLNEMPINVKIANQYFGASALLGFGPAVDQIKFKNLEEVHNPFMMIVYTNLLASLGHREFTFIYHELRGNALQKFGLPIVEEIERLALNKKVEIYSYQEEMKKAKDKAKYISSLINGRSIESEDKKYGKDYWFAIFEANNPSLLSQKS
ncbi:hypothetical protein COB11_06515 [Candidatus Aerophobetes bacterium]|uniref:Sel1 repeat family protein n=1 Tax=Aerophobetes bacterium TaxID=2030807 RepID=A0A2A4YDL5_UNCAE|nr:MAG: hypothetical protein COB11_06515 [Candidatus Aerophobetes bacterium]